MALKQYNNFYKSYARNQIQFYAKRHMRYISEIVATINRITFFIF